MHTSIIATYEIPRSSFTEQAMLYRVSPPHLCIFFVFAIFVRPNFRRLAPMEYQTSFIDFMCFFLVYLLLFFVFIIRG